MEQNIKNIVCKTESLCCIAEINTIVKQLCFNKIMDFFVCFYCTTWACRILVPQPGLESMPPAVGAWSLNHWTTREVPLHFFLSNLWSSQMVTGQESTWNTGELGLIPRSKRSPGEGNGNPLQHSCLENSMDRGAWWATAHGVANSRTQPSD